MATGNVGSVYERLQHNIESISNFPSTPIDTRTFDEAELVLVKTIEPQQRLLLIQSLASLLPQLQQDPTPAVNLLLRLLDDFSYSDVLSLGTQSIPFADGLAVGEHMASYNRLILTLLDKATLNSADAAQVASMLETMLALVRLWLCTPDTGIANQASNLLLDLLRVDKDILEHSDSSLPAAGGGQGLVWKRIFGDRNVYGTFFEACSLSAPSQLKLSRNQKTLAQARLMEWLPSVCAMDWNAISRSHHPDIEAAYGVKGGLLEFTTQRMVDFEDDILMHRCLLDFFSELLRATKPPAGTVAPSNDSPALRYLIEQGLHESTASMCLDKRGSQSDGLESEFRYGPAANYVATYASCYREHYMASRMPARVSQRLVTAFTPIQGMRASAMYPSHDLSLIAHIPREPLIPGGGGSGAWDASPLSLIRSKTEDPAVFSALARIFHGPEKRDTITFPPSSPLNLTTTTTEEREDQAEAAAARALYFHYLANNPTFWRDVAKYADTVALTDLALAAINCLTAVIAANWSTKPEFSIPSAIATPDYGQVAILSPPALEFTLPYLLKPPQRFLNVVGGRGDSGSATFKVASAKMDALTALHNRLAQQIREQPGEGYEEIAATIRKSIAVGWGSGQGEVGGRVGTLEM